jgi:hypothetical protein
MDEQQQLFLKAFAMHSFTHYFKVDDCGSTNELVQMFATSVSTRLDFVLAELDIDGAALRIVNECMTAVRGVIAMSNPASSFSLDPCDSDAVALSKAPEGNTIFGVINSAITKSPYWKDRMKQIVDTYGMTVKYRPAIKQHMKTLVADEIKSLELCDLFALLQRIVKDMECYMASLREVCLTDLKQLLRNALDHYHKSVFKNVVPTLPLPSSAVSITSKGDLENLSKVLQLASSVYPFDASLNDMLEVTGETVRAVCSDSVKDI